MKLPNLFYQRLKLTKKKYWIYKKNLSFFLHLCENRTGFDTARKNKKTATKNLILTCVYNIIICKLERENVIKIIGQKRIFAGFDLVVGDKIFG